jgi:hypothetical protein
MRTKDLIGVRGERNRPPALILEAAVDAINRSEGYSSKVHRHLAEMKSDLSEACRAYYALAACSRRKELEAGLRYKLLSEMYRLRSALERCITERLPLVIDSDSVDKGTFTKSFFGVSQKQGVSLRYPLLSCIPTATCGGRCYAHDGRDRELHLIFRACLNYNIGKKWDAEEASRAEISRRLEPIIQYGVDMAVMDARNAETTSNFARAPRVRFSHLGEMISTPKFVNWLARRIKQINQKVECVVYTRHPNANLYDPGLFVVNFTVDGSGDNRIKYAPSNARIVSSAWDGVIAPEADINFLEHHVEKGAIARGDGIVCPVTENHALTPSCDSAKCDKCFQPARVSPRTIPINKSEATRP